MPLSEIKNYVSYRDLGCVNMGLAFLLVMPTKKWLLDRNLIQQGSAYNDVFEGKMFTPLACLPRILSSSVLG